VFRARKQERGASKGEKDSMRQMIIRRLIGEERFARLKEYQLQARTHPRVATAFARAAAISALRQIDPTRPITWEFSGFSQNGEDGILDYLCGRLLNPGRYFVEIGAANGLENNTSWLALGRRYAGLMIDGDARKIDECAQMFRRMNWALECAALFVNRDNLDEIDRRILVRNPDVFSLDIDGIDFYIAQGVLDRGIRPKIFIMEYNSIFGPSRSVTIPYKPEFNRRREHASGYYYGVSIAGLRHLFRQHGYRFVTVDQNGLNAVFIDPAEFDARFVDAIRGSEYRENVVHRCESRGDTPEQQFNVIRHLPLVEVPSLLNEPLKVVPARGPALEAAS
jgi:hypothetical protein